MTSSFRTCDFQILKGGSHDFLIQKVSASTAKRRISIRKSLAPQQHPVHIKTSGRTATPGYVTMLSSVTFALSASVRTFSVWVTLFLFQKLYQKI